MTPFHERYLPNPTEGFCLALSLPPTVQFNFSQLNAFRGPFPQRFCPLPPLCIVVDTKCYK